jgi:hypothetical protein
MGRIDPRSKWNQDEARRVINASEKRETQGRLATVTGRAKAQGQGHRRQKGHRFIPPSLVTFS